MSVDLIALALAEDIGDGDVTTKFFTDPNATAIGRIIAKEPCIIAGVQTAALVFQRVDPSLRVAVLVRDGDKLGAREGAMTIEGKRAAILTSERTALNFLQRLSGVATLTRRYVDAIEGTGARILDTRKTTPGFRLLEKAAVKAGGGTNHRSGLYDMVMVKDNHLAGGMKTSELADCIRRVKAARSDIRIELEADSLEQLRAFVDLDGIDVILLDNMSLEQLREAVAMRRPPVLLEASGGITLANVRAIAETGVDFISIGALTHSAKAVDLSLEIE